MNDSLMIFHDECGRMVLGDSAFTLGESSMIEPALICQAALMEQYPTWFFAGYSKRGADEPTGIFGWLRQPRRGKSLMIYRKHSTSDWENTRQVYIWDALYFEDARDAVEFRLCFNTTEKAPHV